jgi:hypothetical protein
MYVFMAWLLSALARDMFFERHVLVCDVIMEFVTGNALGSILGERVSAALKQLTGLQTLGLKCTYSWIGCIILACVEC